MTPDLTVRTVRSEDAPDGLAALDEVMRLGFEAPSFAESIAWYLGAQPDALAAAFDGDELVGTGAAIAYPDAGFGWIGLIATRPGHERRGIGSAVTAHLVDVLAHHGCAAVLDASVKGRAVYERLGFVDAGPTVRLARPPGAPVPPAGGRAGPVGPDERGDLVRYDAASFGADRGRLLAFVLDAHPAVAVRDAGGAVTGYAVARPGVIGPVIADDAGTLRELVAAALARSGGGEVRLDVPWESAHRAELGSLGFVEARRLRHMRLGVGALPGARHRVAAQLTLGFG